MKIDRDSIYQYSEGDGLEKPQKYQYPEYKGRSFLAKYKKCRMGTRSELKKRFVETMNKNIKTESDDKKIKTLWLSADLIIDETEGFEKSLKENLSFLSKFSVSQHREHSLTPVWDKIGTDYINTEEILKNLLFSQCTTEGLPSDKISSVLTIFLKKYEVGKRIYVGYTDKFKKKSNDYGHLTNYPLLAINFLLYYKRTADLRFLNGAIKINDMLCSKKKEIGTLIDLYLSMLSIEMELSLMRTLFKSHGVNL